MEQWEAMMGGKTFITDLGEERHAEINGVDTVVGLSLIHIYPGQSTVCPQERSRWHSHTQR